jgi:DNA mismatch endonuclease (patch repair protein)
MDFLSKAERSERMALIKGRDTKPERILRRLLHSFGLRYRLHSKDLPGKPDLVFRKFGAVVFVHGCFWHRHAGCSIATVPKTNWEFWEEKFRLNVKRDSRAVRALRTLGWRVFIVWECRLRTSSMADSTARILARRLVMQTAGPLEHDKPVKKILETRE